MSALQRVPARFSPPHQPPPPLPRVGKGKKTPLALCHRVTTFLLQTTNSWPARRSASARLLRPNLFLAVYASGLSTDHLLADLVFFLVLAATNNHNNGA